MSSREIVEARVAREREWCHARWMERMTFRQIAAAASLPPDRGGLGVALSPAGAKAMVAAHREEMGDVTMSRDERRERQADELDELARALRRQIAERIETNGDVDKDAVKLLLDVGKREADLHGLSAPTEIKAEVTTRDAALDELNAALVAMGEKPVEVGS